MDEEVRIQYLRPEQIAARRRKCPVAYIPLGNLEWHGPHNPLGADTLQAEGLANLCAEKGGGIAFPPLYYGENRHEALMEANSADRIKIAEEMDLPPDNFDIKHHPFSASGQNLNYHKLLLHILAEVESLGFDLGVLVAGHYPLIDHAQAAILIFNKRERRKTGGMLAWACVDYHMVTENYENSPGDHAGGWETSHLMHLHPKTVDLDVYNENSPGVSATKWPVEKSSAEFGKKTFEDAAESVIKEVRHRLDNPELYFQHGMALKQGLWKS